MSPPRFTEWGQRASQFPTRNQTLAFWANRLQSGSHFEVLNLGDGSFGQSRPCAMNTNFLCTCARLFSITRELGEHVAFLSDHRWSTRLFVTLLGTLWCGTLMGQDDAVDADRPRVLIIGDSISLGYTPSVKRMMSEEAEVVHNKGNAQHTGTGLAKLDEWLGEKPWDVIHFNWGLWDLCYRHPDAKTQGRRDKVNGSITLSLADYEKNLEQLVTRLKATDAVLIFATTTPVPEGELGRVIGDDVRYNNAARRVMERHEITINDLHAAVLPRLAELQKPGGDVHFLAEGSEFLAERVAEAVREALARRSDERR